MVASNPVSVETRRSDELFARRLLKVRNKDRQLVPLHYNVVQVDFLTWQSGRDLILKARQLGISTLIQAQIFRQATTVEGTSTATLGHDQSNTDKLRRIHKAFYENLPPDFRPTRRLDNASVTSYKETDSYCMIDTAGSRNAGRGGTYSHIHGSEVAFWVDADAILSGMMQGGHPQIVLESTPNGAQGRFYDLCMETLDGNPDWKLHFYEWWWDQDYRLPLDAGEVLSYTDEEYALVEGKGLDAEQIKWRRQKKRELRRTFAQEYPEDMQSCFLLSGEGYFGALEGVFVLTAVEVSPGLWRAEGLKPHPDHEYVAGIDWGVKVDYTIVSIGDTATKQQVALLRLNQMSPTEIRRRVAQELMYWNTGIIVPEENSALTNIDELRKLVKGVRPFLTSQDSKARGMAGLFDALYEDEWKLLSIPAQKREMRALQVTQTQNGKWRYAAPPGEHDDIPIANMLMIHAATRPKRVAFSW